MNDQISHIFILIFRLAYDTKPDLVLNLLLREWCLERPKLLITTTGGKANFELQPRIKRSLRRGLLKAAKVTFIYYVRTCRGEEGSENGHFCLLSVLKISLLRGGGALCVETEFKRTFQASTKCNNINSVWCYFY